MLHIDSTKSRHQDLIPVELDCMRDDWYFRILVEEVNQHFCAISAKSFAIASFQSPLSELVELFCLSIDIFIWQELSFVHVLALTLLVPNSSDADGFGFLLASGLEVYHVEVILLFLLPSSLLYLRFLELPLTL